MFSHAGAALPSTSSRSHIVDEEFGVIQCRRSAQARYVRIRISEGGEVRASLPKRAPLYMVQELLESSRDQIRELIRQQTSKKTIYENGMEIGHSHKLFISHEDTASPQGSVRNQQVNIRLPVSTPEHTQEAQSFISSYVKKALKKEATAYLPRRLRYLADTYGFSYERERFGNQTGRWGSCSSAGTISLNVALMNLPHEIIDYVLIHELAHTKQMNHSQKFWQLVEQCHPEYRQHRKILKSMSPIC